jgi:putative transposase
MSYNPLIHHRRSIRLKEYDYSGEGIYFITLCVEGRLPLLGTIEKGEIKHSKK